MAHFQVVLLQLFWYLQVCKLLYRILRKHSNYVEFNIDSEIVYRYQTDFVFLTVFLKFRSNFLGCFQPRKLLPTLLVSISGPTHIQGVGKILNMYKHEENVVFTRSTYNP